MTYIKSNKYKVTSSRFRKCKNKNPFTLRSKLELKFVQLIDFAENVIEWVCEPFSIPYYFSVDKKVHNYTPDFLIKTTTETLIIEIKPYKKLLKESQKTDDDKIDFIRNTDKWNAANKFCEENNLVFKIVTEKDVK